MRISSGFESLYSTAGFCVLSTIVIVPTSPSVVGLLALTSRSKSLHWMVSLSCWPQTVMSNSSSTPRPNMYQSMLLAWGAGFLSGVLCLGASLG